MFVLLDISYVLSLYLQDYQSLLNMEGINKFDSDIAKDLPRTLPKSPIFNGPNSEGFSFIFSNCTLKNNQSHLQNINCKEYFRTIRKMKENTLTISSFPYQQSNRTAKYSAGIFSIQSVCGLLPRNELHCRLFVSQSSKLGSCILGICKYYAKSERTFYGRRSTA